ncbi:hypothetical protein WH47_06262 [Habropoda laboriosa]|uniref:Uncharacterized protein n=1 Tax=Habropoda laboriosa TaxID=597456 RepID=A0A0L7RKD0_9HYME|nr:hypothetical protein WH47_06262 [Habropoda laboriosa]
MFTPWKLKKNVNVTRIARPIVLFTLLLNIRCSEFACVGLRESRGSQEISLWFCTIPIKRNTPSSSTSTQYTNYQDFEALAMSRKARMFLLRICKTVGYR